MGPIATSASDFFPCEEPPPDTRLVVVWAVFASYTFRHVIRFAKGLIMCKPFPTVSRRE
jgi:hypothetical protein